MRDEAKEYDLVVIGGGPAGVIGARTANVLGKSVVAPTPWCASPGGLKRPRPAERDARPPPWRTKAWALGKKSDHRA